MCVDNLIRHSETALASLRLQKFRLRSALSLLSQRVEAADCEREHLCCQHSTALKGRPLEASSPFRVPPALLGKTAAFQAGVLLFLSLEKELNRRCIE